MARTEGKIVALAGGIGAARFLEGLTQTVAPEKVIVIGNVGDDAEVHGLHISPDLDTVMYTLAGLSNKAHGWGLEADTFECLNALGRIGAENWFRLGDRDIATHLFRTEQLRQGITLAEVTRKLSRALGVRSTIFPATNHRLRTIIKVNRGTLEFQDWFVRRRARDLVKGVQFHGRKLARPAPGVIEAIASAQGIILCPSNPLISLNPILTICGIRNALRSSHAPIIAISPIVGGRALKGPSDRMMKSLGMEVSALGVARLYRDFVDVFVLDAIDQEKAPAIEQLGMRVVITDTIMSGLDKKKALAATVLDAMKTIR